ncbi:unnamed protein product [Effrenium voratum]|uniref:Uncharacterized protein n=1 Tax=Effrenium voratum TaxID=2562239 RepID=A0AA36MH95_9DINO|nr:unnamed protein product [Effrenium voratum]
MRNVENARQKEAEAMVRRACREMELLTTVVLDQLEVALKDSMMSLRRAAQRQPGFLQSRASKLPSLANVRLLPSNGFQTVPDVAATLEQQRDKQEGAPSGDLRLTWLEFCLACADLIPCFLARCSEVALAELGKPAGPAGGKQNIFAVDMFGSVRLAWAVLLVSSASAQLASELTKEQLKPLTVFRQQHRMRAANAPPCCGAVRMCLNSLWLAVVDYDALRSSAAAGAVAAAEKNIFAVDMFGSARLAWAVLLVSSASAQLASELTKEQLKPLTVDGRLCAACARLLLCRRGEPRAPSPDGGSGREWCYVEAQARERMCWNSLWLAVVDYDALRSSAAAGAVAAAEKVKSYVVKFGKAQRASENYDWVLMLSAPSAVGQVQGKKGDFRQNIFAVDMFGSARLAWAVLLVSSASAQLASELTKEQLKPLTAPSPDGGSGREWCYVEAQLVSSGKSESWGYCGQCCGL